MDWFRTIDLNEPAVEELNPGDRMNGTNGQVDGTEAATNCRHHASGSNAAHSAGGGSGAGPPTGDGSGAVPSAGTGSGAVPSAGNGTGAGPSAGTGSGAVPSAGNGTGAGPSASNGSAAGLSARRATGSAMRTGVTLSSEDSGSDDEVQSTPEGSIPWFLQN